MTRRQFSREFKREAVQLVTGRGVSVAQVARDLDLHQTVLRRWVQQYRDAPETAFPGKGQMKPEDEEVRRLAWKLCTTMKATDVSDTLDIALQAAGLDQVKVRHRPRLLSDNGPSYVSGELAKWLEAQGMAHTRGRPYHPMTQGKIERWHRSLKNQILLDNYYLPGQLEQRIGQFVTHYNTRRYHESLNNLTPEDVYLRRGQAILNEREKIKRATMDRRRRLHRQTVAA